MTIFEQDILGRSCHKAGKRGIDDITGLISEHADMIDKTDELTSPMLREKDGLGLNVDHCGAALVIRSKRR